MILNFSLLSVQTGIKHQHLNKSGTVGLDCLYCIWEYINRLLNTVSYTYLVATTTFRGNQNPSTHMTVTLTPFSLLAHLLQPKSHISSTFAFPLKALQQLLWNDHELNWCNPWMLFQSWLWDSPLSGHFLHVMAKMCNVPSWSCNWHYPQPKMTLIL